MAADACLLRSLLLNAWRGEKAEPFLILEEYDDDDDNAEQQHLQIPRIDVVVVIIAGSTRVFSPLFFCGEGGEEESSLPNNKYIFYYRNVLRLLFVFFEKRGGRLSLSRRGWNSGFWRTTAQDKKKQRIIKMIEEKNLFDQKEKANGERKF